MYDYLELGSTPCDESCVQVISKRDYFSEMQAECNRYRDQLEKTFPVPETIKGLVYFCTRTFRHEFGSYMEVVISYNESALGASKFAYFVEDNLPANWIEDPTPIEFVFEGEPI